MKGASGLGGFWGPGLLAAIALSSGLRAQDPVGTVEVESRGPQTSFECDAGWESTWVDFKQSAGERERLRLPLVGRRNSAGLNAQPAMAAGTERVELLPQTLDWPRPWSELPRSLQSRTLPPVQRAGPRVGDLQWAWLALSVVLVLALRRRPWLALTLGTLSAVMLYTVIPSSQQPKVPRVRVLEGDGQGHWLELRGAQDRLRIESRAPGWLSRLPNHSKLHIEWRGGEHRSWAFCSPGARLFYSREVKLPESPRTDSPGGQRFEQVWLRLPGQGWTAHGPWSGAEPLPGAIEGGSAPPGWLASSLPQGRPILLGRLESDPQEPAWLRLYGFE